VNDKAIKAETITGTVQRLPGGIRVFVNSKPSTEGAWTVSIDPVTGTAFADLQYAAVGGRSEEMTAKLFAMAR